MAEPGGGVVTAVSAAPSLAWSGAVQRPAFGASGRKVKVFANHFDVRCNLEEAIMYDIAIADAPFLDERGQPLPPRAPRAPRAGPVRPMPKSLCRALVKALADSNGWTNWCYDGQKALYTSEPLAVRGDLDQGVTFTVSHVKEDLRTKDFLVTVKHTKNDVIVISASLEAFIRGGGVLPQDALQVLDTACRHKRGFSEDWLALGRTFLAYRSTRPIGAGLSMMLGYQMSVRPTQSGLVVIMDRAAGAFYKEGRVLDLVTESVFGIDPRAGLHRQRTAQQWHKVARLLKGLKVARVTRKGVVIKKVLSITEGGADEAMFPLHARGAPRDAPPEREVSVAAYFAETGHPLQYPRMPCVILSKPNQPKVWIPFEQCTVVKGQRLQLVREGTASAAMIQETAQHPDRRWREIEKLMHESGLASDSTVRAFGMTVGTAMKEVDARVLKAPTVLYANRKTVTAQDGAWNMRDCALLEPTPVKAWQLVVFNDGTRPGPPIDAVQLMGQLVQGFKRSANLDLAPRTVAPPVVQTRGEMAAAVLGRALAAPVQIVLIVLPDDDAGRYGDVKKFMDGERGVPSQCMLAKHMLGRPPRGAPPGKRGTGGPDLQYLANVALKINAKLGGRNNSLAPGPGETPNTVLPVISDPGVLIMGADVSHPPLRSGQTAAQVSSMSAVVASVDVAHSRYAADLMLQSGEVLSTLDVMCMRLIKLRYQKTRAKPHSIIFFRDGVSEGQFKTVVENEANAILRACHSIEAGYRPKLTFVVVQKRHNTRFFVSAPSDADRSGNIPAGTVVDSAVCHPSEYDFFLCSHGGLKGTSRPVHYHVLLDEIGIGPDNLQNLCYRLCHLYARATRSVSLVPPVYYAHLAAERAKILSGADLSDYATETASQHSGAGSAGGSTMGRRSEPLKVSGGIAPSMYWI